MPPGPSSPPAMPSSMKTSSSGAPRRDDTSLATMLTTSSSAPIRMAVFQSSIGASSIPNRSRKAKIGQGRVRCTGDRYPLGRMRVICRMLVGALAIVFALGFVARLWRGGQRVQRRYAPAWEGEDAAPVGGYSWGPRILPAELQKTVGLMNYAMGQNPGAREHEAHESPRFDRTVPRDRDGLRPGPGSEQGEDADPAYGGARGGGHG